MLDPLSKTLYSQFLHSTQFSLKLKITILLHAKSVFTHAVQCKHYCKDEAWWLLLKSDNIFFVSFPFLLLLLFLGVKYLSYFYLPHHLTQLSTLVPCHLQIAHLLPHLRIKTTSNNKKLQCFIMHYANQTCYPHIVKRWVSPGLLALDSVSAIYSLYNFHVGSDVNAISQSFCMPPCWYVSFRCMLIHSVGLSLRASLMACLIKCALMSQPTWNCTDWNIKHIAHLKNKVYIICNK